MNTEEIIIFTHIPKTGGMTLESILNRVYRQMFPYGRFDRILDRLIAHKDKFFNRMHKRGLKVITGHFGYSPELNAALDRPTSYITLLRDPVELKISLFYFLQDLKHIYPKLVPYSTETPPTTLEEAATRHCNIQTQYLAGGTDDLSLAKERLEKEYKAFGITELYPQSIQLFAKILGWDAIPDYKELHKGKNRPLTKDVPQATIDLIKEHNSLDIELYEWAKELFRERLRHREMIIG